MHCLVALCLQALLRWAVYLCSLVRAAAGFTAAAARPHQQTPSEPPPTAPSRCHMQLPAAATIMQPGPVVASVQDTAKALSAKAVRAAVVPAAAGAASEQGTGLLALTAASCSGPSAAAESLPAAAITVTSPAACQLHQGLQRQLRCHLTHQLL